MTRGKAKKQLYAIDAAKYVSAILVVAIHTFPFLEISAEFNTLFIAMVCRLAVPFFFTASAYFLFKKIRLKRSEMGWNEKTVFRFLKRILLLYLVWTVIYLPYTLWNFASTGFSILSILGWIRDFFLNGSYYHLWFLPALMLGTWIVWKLFREYSFPKMLLICLILYVVGYVINIYGPLMQQAAGLSLLYGFFEKTLVTARDGIFFAPIFVALGFLLAKTKRLPMKISAIGFALSYLLLILEVTVYFSFGILTDLSSMFLFLVPTIYFLMNILLQLNLKPSPVYKELRFDSTIIYVSQILFARILLILLPNAHLVVFLGTVGCAQILAFIIAHFLPTNKWLRYLV